MPEARRAAKEEVEHAHAGIVERPDTWPRIVPREEKVVKVAVESSLAVEKEEDQAAVTKDRVEKAAKV